MLDLYIVDGPMGRGRWGVEIQGDGALLEEEVTGGRCLWMYCS